MESDRRWSWITIFHVKMENLASVRPMVTNCGLSFSKKLGPKSMAVTSVSRLVSPITS